jgi:hypothetical protein
VSFWKSIGEKLFASVISRAVEERLPAATSSALEEMQWRRLTGNSARELPIATWQRQVEICYWLWKINPLGNWIIETLTTMAAGKGFTYSADNAEVQDLLESFWYDPVNRMDIKLEQKARELFLFGLQCWPVFVAEQTGRVRLGMVDPAQISEVYADPQNAEVRIGVKVQNLDGTGTRIMRVILTGETETVVSEPARQMREGWTDGECFLFAINRVSNDPYGTSDLFVIADWLDEYEDFVFKYSEKAKKQNAYIWDVEIDGADEKTCDAFAQKFPHQADGAVRVHNEKVTWQAVAPDLKALEIKEAAAVFRNHILGNKSIPQHWYGGSGDVNRATAGESNEPIKALIDSRQNLLKFIIETMFTFVIQKAREASYLKVSDEEAFKFAVQKPETMDKDITKVSTAVRDIVTSLVAAAAQNWIDQDNAVKVFAFVLALVGYELDPAAMDLEAPEFKDYKDKPGTRKGKGDKTEPGEE